MQSPPPVPLPCHHAECCYKFLLPAVGTADSEIKLPSSENRGLSKFLSFPFGVGQNRSVAFRYYQDHIQTSNLIHLYYFPALF